MGFPGGPDGKESPCSAGDVGSVSEWRRFPWRRKWPPTPVLLPGEAQTRQRNLAGYSEPMEITKESDTTGATNAFKRDVVSF